VRNKLVMSNRVHRYGRDLPKESRQVLPGLSPEVGFTSMTPCAAAYGDGGQKIVQSPEGGDTKIVSTAAV
jgi:hypothetical protein